jgi:hypothetical protein
VKRIATVVLLGLLWGAPAWAQTPAPLTVGAVHDQGGEPIVQAQVRLFGADGRLLGSARTGDDGTFAAAVSGSSKARITCDFCETLDLNVRGDEPVVAIVRRFDALLHDVPNQDDADALPYGHVESTLSLAPFAVLADSSGIVAGPMISDRGLSRAGGLVVDHGVPNYDFAANISPFLTVPSRALTQFERSDAGAAFRYGDRADAGTFSIGAPQTNDSVLLAAGSDDLARVQLTGSATGVGAALSGDSVERRALLDADASAAFADGSANVSLLMSRGTLAPFENYFLDESFDGARFSAQRIRAQRRYVEFTADHGTYSIWNAGGVDDAQWSDISGRAGIETLGQTRAFFEVTARKSNAYYDTHGPIPSLAGGLTQFQITGGIRSHSAASDLEAGISGYDVAFSGGPIEQEYASSALGAGTTLVTPSLDYTYHRSPYWNFNVVAASTFRLPTLLERSGMLPVQDTVTLDRNSLLQTTFSLTERSRVHSSMTAYRQLTSGLDRGSVAGVGAALAWQIAPALSLRSWVLHETDSTAPVFAVLRLTPANVSATVGSAWLTYESAGIRADAVYRRDLVDTSAFSHFDYALSVPLATKVRLFSGSEVRHGARFFDVGLRLLAP